MCAWRWRWWPIGPCRRMLRRREGGCCDGRPVRPRCERKLAGAGERRWGTMTTVPERLRMPRWTYWAIADKGCMRRGRCPYLQALDSAAGCARTASYFNIGKGSRPWAGKGRGDHDPAQDALRERSKGRGDHDPAQDALRERSLPGARRNWRDLLRTRLSDACGRTAGAGRDQSARFSAWCDRAWRAPGPCRACPCTDHHTRDRDRQLGRRFDTCLCEGLRRAL